MRARPEPRAAKALKVTFSDEFRAVAGCNGVAGSGASNDQYDPVNQTCVLTGVSAGARTFSAYSTSNNIDSSPVTSCGTNVLLEELP